MMPMRVCRFDTILLSLLLLAIVLGQVFRQRADCSLSQQIVHELEFGLRLLSNDRFVNDKRALKTGKLCRPIVAGLVWIAELECSHADGVLSQKFAVVLVLFRPGK